MNCISFCSVTGSPCTAVMMGGAGIDYGDIRKYVPALRPDCGLQRAMESGDVLKEGFLVKKVSVRGSVPALVSQYMRELLLVWLGSV